MTDISVCLRHIESLIYVFMFLFSSKQSHRSLDIFGVTFKRVMSQKQNTVDQSDEGQVTFASWNVRLMSDVQPKQICPSDKSARSPAALGLAPVEVTSGPAALRLQSLLNVSVMSQENENGLFSLLLLNSFIPFSVLQHTS